MCTVCAPAIGSVEGGRPAKGDRAVTAVQPKQGALIQDGCVDPTGDGTPSCIATLAGSASIHDASSGMPLRVAVLAPIAWRTPPRHYGPWEQFASLLTEGLVTRGHDVTLFATSRLGDDVRQLHGTSPCGWSEDPSIDPKVAECLHIASVFERADEFDIIHNSFDFLPLTYSRLVDTPVVTTIHGFSSPKIVHGLRALRRRRRAMWRSATADRHPRLHYAATVHHGIDTECLLRRSGPGRTPPLLRTDPSRQGHRPRDRRRPPHRTPARHRRHHPGRGVLPRPASNHTSTASTSAISARSIRPCGPPR